MGGALHTPPKAECECYDISTLPDHSSLGDPEGHRQARIKALALSEAAAVTRALLVLLRRADFEADECEEMLKRIVKREAIEVQRGVGHLESRRRFKGHASQPLLDHRPAMFLHLDESGKSFPEPRLSGPRFFALAGIAMDQENTDQYRAAADAIKMEFFGTTDMTFHEPLMRLRDGPYYFGGDLKRQDAFDEAIARIISESEFVAFGTGVRKSAFETEFVAEGLDPYLPTDSYALAIMLLLERFVDYLATAPVKYMGRLVFESQGPKEDAQHQLQYTLVLIDGSQWVPPSAFLNWLEAGCHFTPKSGSDPTELSDILTREIYEWIRDDCKVTPKFWELFYPKLYSRDDGMVGKFGLKVFPDTDVREAVLEHRRECGVTGN